MFSHGFRQLMRDQEMVEELARGYRQARPFPNIAFEGIGLWSVFEQNLALLMAAEFPKPDASWWKYDNAFERKFAKNTDLDQYPLISAAIQRLNSGAFVAFLERLTGIEGLIVDATLNGGGLHQIATGGKLDVHADYNIHPVTKLDRRINVLLYLNPGWSPDWGGQLELWAKDMSQAEKMIPPSLGTLVIFNSTDTSWHGHPRALECPEGVTRKSIATYYYTNGRPESERSAPHSTIYKARPGDSRDAETEALREKRAKGRLVT